MDRFGRAGAYHRNRQEHKAPPNAESSPAHLFRHSGFPPFPRFEWELLSPASVAEIYHRPVKKVKAGKERKKPLHDRAE
jgi:hypothetical protein